jgi:transposase
MEVSFSPQEVLETYKSQQSVERGFRFLKSPLYRIKIENARLSAYDGKTY